MVETVKAKLTVQEVVKAKVTEVSTYLETVGKQKDAELEQSNKALDQANQQLGDIKTSLVDKGYANENTPYSQLDDIIVALEDENESLDNVKQALIDKGLADESTNYSEMDEIINNVNFTDSLDLRLEQTEEYEYSNNKVTTLPQCFFYNDKKIQKASFPNVTTIETKCFERSSIKEVYLPNLTTFVGPAFVLSELEKISLPNLTAVVTQTFENCQKLRYANLPNASGSDYYLFQNCHRLESAYVPKLTSIETFSFNNCYSLKALILGGTSVISLSKTGAFGGAVHIQGAVNETYNPTGAQDGYIYVPDNLVSTYKSATNWSTYASQIKGLSELPQEYKDLYGIE